MKKTSKKSKMEKGGSVIAMPIGTKSRMVPASNMKKGGSFPDLTGDGKVTKADVLKGRGVFKKGGEKNWIKGAIKKPGALREQMGAKKGETIPVSKLRDAAKKGGKLGQRARLAMTLKKMNKK
jgi:hypothetical protein